MVSHESGRGYLIYTNRLYNTSTSSQRSYIHATKPVASEQKPEANVFFPKCLLHSNILQIRPSRFVYRLPSVYINHTHGAYFAPEDSAMNELDVLRLENDTLRRKLTSLDDKVRCIEENHTQRESGNSRRDKVEEAAWLGQEASLEVQQLSGILQRLDVRPRQVSHVVESEDKKYFADCDSKKHVFPTNISYRSH